MSRFNPKSIQTRAVSAAVMIPAVLLAVFYGGFPFYLMVFVLAGISVQEWFGMARKTDRFMTLGLGGAGYILIGFLCCVLIREDASFLAAILFLLMVWSADIGAYFTGKFVGGPKLAPAISPNKTWAGFAGACDFAGCIGVIFYLGYQFLSDTPQWDVMTILYVFVLGLVVGGVGQVGDLLVSMMKRRAGVKDTGAIIPGHGGVLDRVDAMLLAAPAFYILYDLFKLGF